jgi:hypothetical protein
MSEQAAPTIGNHAYRNALIRQRQLREELARVDAFLAMFPHFAGEDMAPRPKRASNEELYAAVRRVLLDNGRPMTRSDIVDELRQRGVQIDSKEPTNWLGTRLWRSGGQFVQIGTAGCWPADVPFAALGYDPASAARYPATR